MRTIIFSLLLLGLGLSAAVSEVKIVKGRYGLDITGEPTGFDPTNPHVFVRKPQGQETAPVLLYIHGGGGLTPGERQIPEFFQSLGFATVAFDAFKLNKIEGLSSEELSTKLSLPAKQKMLVPVAEQALDWISNQTWADKSKVYIYGHSNGARVALFMANSVAARNVRLIFADAPAHCCIPLPKTLNAPVKLIVGDNDNYGGRHGSDMLYTRPNPETGLSTKEWAKIQSASGMLEIKFYAGGHGIFLGKNIPSVRARGTEWRRGGDAQSLKADIRRWLAENSQP